MTRPGVLVCAAAVTVIGCGSGSIAAGGNLVTLPGDPVPLTEVRAFPLPQTGLTWYSGYATPQRLVIRTPEAWAQAWTTIFQNGGGPADPPPVDFARQMVLVAATGVRSSGGYGIAMPKAALDRGVLRVEVVETTPGSDCGVTGVITSPVAAVRLDRHDGEVLFVDAITVHMCGGADCTMVFTPAGPAPKACVHEVPSGATISTQPDGTTVVTLDGKVVATYPPCACST